MKNTESVYDSPYYNGAKLLSMKDARGLDPEIYICTSNRTAGKTTFFNRKMINGFKKKGRKFAILYRYISELEDCSNKFFKDIGGLFFPGDTLSSRGRAKGVYHELFLNEKSCGFALALNAADKIKRYSHLFSDVGEMMLDEFQSESNDYCPNEIQKFRSIHTSIARGQGSMVRRVPVYLVGNPVSIINPYYVAMGISDRLTSHVRFLRGNGYVLEQGRNDAATAAQKDSAFNMAFDNGMDNYGAYTSEGVYLNDNLAFIERPAGQSRYVCTLRYMGQDYSIKEYGDQGIVYCDDRADKYFPVRISVTTDDHQINYVMLRRNDLFLAHMRGLFQRGCFRFKNLRCKEAVLRALTF